ncbi:MAG: hypothetical protein NXI20_07925 [bacterium]|nr:hypothetical protein [bacterium]
MNPSEQISDQSILLFYGWWQMAVCLFAFLGLMAIWWHLGKKQGDFGQVWLALSILAWSLSGAAEVFFATRNPVNPVYLDGFRSIFSLFNSLFILLGLPWFRYIPKPFKSIIQSNFWLVIVGLPFVFSLLPTISRMISGNSLQFVNELDVYYAVLTLAFLGYVLWESFEKRRLRFLAWLSLVCVLTTLVAQAYKLTDSTVNLTLFSAIFKTALIMLFFALALSWVKELSSIIIPGPTQLFLSFSKEKNEKQKYEHIINLQGIPGKSDPIILTPGMFNLLLKFAVKKLDGSDWLELKPKNDPRSDYTYDIKDHNELRRLLAALLDGIFGKNQWTKEQHEQPLKQSLFDSPPDMERKIRLAIPKENLVIPENLTHSN